MLLVLGRLEDQGLRLVCLEGTWRVFSYPRSVATDSGLRGISADMLASRPNLPERSKIKISDSVSQWKKRCSTDAADVACLGER